MASCAFYKKTLKATDKGSQGAKVPPKRTQENYATNMEKL